MPHLVGNACHPGYLLGARASASLGGLLLPSDTAFLCHSQKLFLRSAVHTPPTHHRSTGSLSCGQWVHDPAHLAGHPP